MLRLILAGIAAVLSCLNAKNPPLCFYWGLVCVYWFTNYIVGQMSRRS